MKGSLTDHNQEFNKLVGNLSETIREVTDPVAIATMLYTIAEEKKSSNLVVRDINSKLDNLLNKIDKLQNEVDELREKITKAGGKQAETKQMPLSDRDMEILEYVKEKDVVCADDVQSRFNYRGRNAASARLSKLFKSGYLEKIYRGQKVYYTQK